jgi:hypothetical protein
MGNPIPSISELATKRAERIIRACLNLYGVIKLADLVTVHNWYEKAPITMEELKTVIKNMSDYAEGNLFLRYNILSNALFDLQDPEDYQTAKDILAKQAHKPRYLPKKEEFLKYIDEDYVEPMEPLLELERFIIKNRLVPFTNSEEIRFDVLELHDQVVFDEPIDHFTVYMDKRGYKFDSMVQIKALFALIMNVHNHTRMMENNGHTPLEIHALFESKNTTGA